MGRERKKSNFGNILFQFTEAQILLIAISIRLKIRVPKDFSDE